MNHTDLTITIESLMSDTDDLSSVLNWNPNHKPETKLSKTDLLVLSAAGYRARCVDPANTIGLLDTIAGATVTPADVEMATAIRDYYSKRLMLWALNERTLSKFRQALRDFILSNGVTYTDEMLPMIYRLPEFFKADTDFDQYKTQVQPYNNITLASDRERKLKPELKINVKKRSGKVYEYWMQDEFGQPVMLQFEQQNMLTALWDREFAKDTITCKFSCQVQNRDGFVYLRIGKLLSV